MEQKESKKINVYDIFWCFVIFSVIGLLIETAYCYMTTGVLESRKGLLYGPFCPVYGIGATVIIIVLDRYKNNTTKLFIYGFLVGNIIEYILSYILEAIYGTRFWDYSYITLNLNGRISVIYSIFWGVLSVLLIKLIKPKIDILLNKLSFKLLKFISIIIFILFVFNALATLWGVTSYKKRAMDSYYGQEVFVKNNIIRYIESTFFSNEIISKTFPNLRFIDKSGKEIFIRNVI